MVSNPGASRFVRRFVLAFAFTLAPTVARAAAGDLDPTFGVNGRVTIDFANTNSFDSANGLAIQPDGNIVLAGQAWNGSKYAFGLARRLLHVGRDADRLYDLRGWMRVEQHEISVLLDPLRARGGRKLPKRVKSKFTNSLRDLHERQPIGVAVGLICRPVGLVGSTKPTRSEEQRVVVNAILVILLLGFVGLGAWFLIRASGGRRR